MKASLIRVVLPLGIVLTGCVSTKYKLAPQGTAPAAVLNLVAAPSPIEVIVHTVVAFKGPGAWKREAHWDEYVITIANRGDTPVTLESATLVDFRGLQVGTGDKCRDAE